MCGLPNCLFVVQPSERAALVRETVRGPLVLSYMYRECGGIPPYMAHPCPLKELRTGRAPQKRDPRIAQVRAGSTQSLHSLEMFIEQTW